MRKSGGIEINSSNITDYANKICFALNRKEFVSRKVLSESLGLSDGQTQKIIKWIRGGAIRTGNLDKYINFYIISGKKGYKLPSNEEKDIELAKLYKTLKSWANSISKTLVPCEDYFHKHNIDPAELWSKDDDEFTEAELEIMNDFFNKFNEDPKNTAWFLDKEA